MDRARTAGAFLKTENLLLINFRFGHDAASLTWEVEMPTDLLLLSTAVCGVPDLSELGAILDWIKAQVIGKTHEREILSAFAMTIAFQSRNLLALTWMSRM